MRRGGATETLNARAADGRLSRLGHLGLGKCRTDVGRFTLNRGGASGIVHSRAEPWVAQVLQRGNGVHIGLAMFRPTATVYEGTSEELVLRLIAMLVGTRTIRKATNRGVVLHLVQMIGVSTYVPCSCLWVSSYRPLIRRRSLQCCRSSREVAPLPRRLVIVTNVTHC